MAESRRQATQSPKETKKRSKSSDGRAHNRYCLLHSVSLDEKTEVVNRKKKRHLKTEIIALDSAKSIIEIQLHQEKHKNELLDQENTHVKSLFEKCEQRLEKVTEDNALLESKNASLTEKLMANEKTSAALTEKLRAEEANNAALKEKLTTQDARNTSLKEKLIEEEAKIVTLTDKVTTEEAYCATLKERLNTVKDDLENTKRDMYQQLTDERKDHCALVHHFAKLLEDCQAKVYITGSSETVQVGGTNIIQEKLKADWEELTEKLCFALNEHMVQRRDLEMKLHNDEVLLKEMKDSVQEILQSIDKTTAKKLGHCKDLLEFLISDRSDESVLTAGIRQLKAHLSTTTEKIQLPILAEAAVTRLLNKFDGLNCKQFLEVLEGKVLHQDSANVEETNRKEVFRDETIFDQVGETLEKPLDRNVCIDILSKWFNQSMDNDEEQLLGRITVFESKISARMFLKYQEELKYGKVSERRVQTRKDEIETPAGDLVRTQSLQGLPDALSQFMHQLEGLKIVLQIDRKIDKLCNALKVPDLHDYSSETLL